MGLCVAQEPASMDESDILYKMNLSHYHLPIRSRCTWKTLKETVKVVYFMPKNMSNFNQVHSTHSHHDT